MLPKLRSSFSLRQFCSLRVTSAINLCINSRNTTQYNTIGYNSRKNEFRHGEKLRKRS